MDVIDDSNLSSDPSIDPISLDSSDSKKDNIEFQKELLLVSLIEKMCSNYDKNVFDGLCEYLLKRKILSDKSVYSDDLSNVRYMYMKHLYDMMHKYNPKKGNPLDNPNQLITLPNKNNALIPHQIIYNVPSHLSRYNSDFKEVSSIGKGAYGKVVCAYNALDGVEYAIKKIRIKNFDYQHNTKMLREVKYVALLDHPNIVRYYGSWIEFENNGMMVNVSLDDNKLIDYKSDDSGLSYTASNEVDDVIVFNQSGEKTTMQSALYIQMQLCNKTLKQWIIDRNNIDKIVDIVEVKKIMKQICEGVKYIHSMGLIHRDLKPTNIFFDKNNVVKIGDFGLVTLNKKMTTPPVISDELSITLYKFDKYSSGVGTELYASPEQLRSNNYDHMTDIYSLGIIYFELLYPFKTEMERVITLDKLKREIIPNDFSFLDEINIIKKLLSKHPQDRYIIDELIILMN